MILPLWLAGAAAALPGQQPTREGAPPFPRPGALEPLRYFELRTAVMEAVRRDDHATVLSLSDSLVVAFPFDSEVWGRRGLSALALGRTSEATGSLARAFELGTYAQPYVALRAAEAWFARERPDSAFAWLERALEAGLEDRVELQEDERTRPFLSDPTFRRLVGLPPDTSAGRDERWRHDLDFLLTEIRRLRPAVNGPALPVRLEEAADELRREIPTLSDREVVLRTARLVGALRDGHSVVYLGQRWGEPLEDREQLPVAFWLFPEGLYVVDAGSAHPDLVGSRVDAIGDLEPEEVLRRVEPWVARDNAMTPVWLGVEFYLRSPTMLGRIGAADSAEGVRLRLSEPDGASREVTLEPGSSELPRKLRPAPGVPTPRWLSRMDEPIWMERLPDHDALYVQFNQVRDPEGGSLEAFADSLGAELQASGAVGLVVDVRHNNGGNNGLLRPLIRRMIAWEVADPERRVVVLMGRNTFSAAQNFLNRVERWTDAVFVGEPSSSRPNMIGESTNVVLPYSRLWVSVSSRYWQDSDPGDERPFISPDAPVAYTAADHFGGRDPVLRAALEILERREEGE